MIIKSDNDIGNEFFVILDQKIDKDIFIEINNSDNKIILVDDKISSINKFKKYLLKYDVTISMHGLDLINRIRHGERYKLILLDDEIEPLNGYTVMKKLQKIEEFDINTIVLLNRDKEIIKDKYLELGFIDYIMKDNIEKDLNKIKKYL